jgi:hypothetical protein
VSGAASIHARLLNGAKLRGEDFNHVFMRYAIERFLYRLSITPALDEIIFPTLLSDLLEPNLRVYSRAGTHSDCSSNPRVCNGSASIRLAIEIKLLSFLVDKIA